jgi:hypothetical protein
MDSAGWTLEEAREHTVVERLRERCAIYSNGRTCKQRELPHEDWCERCLAAEIIEWSPRGRVALLVGARTYKFNIRGAEEALEYIRRFPAHNAGSEPRKRTV